MDPNSKCLQPKWLVNQRPLWHCATMTMVLQRGPRGSPSVEVEDRGQAEVGGYREDSTFQHPSC